jgi:signal transduction histidine kinase
MGLGVRRAVGPRVRRMEDAVTRFRDSGQVTPIDDHGDDDLGVLANTLSVSFKAIAERDRERHRFLAVAAHELKTPLTTLKGFAQAALSHADDPARCHRALAVIDRQATRLSRLTQDLLWSARADAGRLPFHPAPLDIDALARRVVGEVELASTDHPFHLVSDHCPHLLGDAALLEQAVWNMLVQAASIAPDGDPVQLTIDSTSTRARLTVEARSELRLPDDIDELAEPFAALPFERREVRGTGLGLYLVRMIARLHGASFHMGRGPGGLFAAVLDLRR